MPPTNDTDEQNQPGLTLPRWFLIVVSAILATCAIPVLSWAVWVTLAILSMAPMTSDSTARIKALEATQQNHALQLQTFNASRFESRLDRIETGVQSLQRDFDRTLGKIKDME
jgi:hypothetical protein